MQTETRGGGAPWTGKAVDAFGVETVPANRNPAASLWPSGETSTDGSGIDLRQPRLIPRQAIGLLFIRLRQVDPAAPQQGGNALGQQLGQLPDFTVFWRP